jgi:hypothetical protein
MPQEKHHWIVVKHICQFVSQMILYLGPLLQCVLILFTVFLERLEPVYEIVVEKEFEKIQQQQQHMQQQQMQQQQSRRQDILDMDSSLDSNRTRNITADSRTTRNRKKPSGGVGEPPARQENRFFIGGSGAAAGPQISMQKQILFLSVFPYIIYYWK